MDILYLLIQFLPLEYAAITKDVLADIGALSVVLVAAKPLLERLPPGARKWVDGIAAVLEYVALNTKPLHERTPRQPKETILPPPGDEPVELIASLPPPSQETRDLVDLLRAAKIKERKP